MLRKQVYGAKLNKTLNHVAEKQIVHKEANPYDNIIIAPRKAMPSTVMNSREKLAIMGEHKIPVTAQENRNTVRSEMRKDGKQSAGKSGGFSQMATTAPRNEDDYNSGGRVTAEL